MAKQRKPLAQTKHVDQWKCPWCRELGGDDTDLTDGTPDVHTDYIVECPNCGKEVSVMMSVEYLCQPIEEVENDG